MTCDEFWKGNPELPGGPEPGGHLHECPACAALMERHRALAEGLRRIAKEGESLQPSAAVELRLVEAFRGRSIGSSSRPGYWLSWTATAAALVALSVLWIRPHQPNRAALTDQSQTQVSAAAADPDATDSEFVPLPYAADLSEDGPSEDDDLVRVEVPRSALVALGVPVPMEAGASRVEAVVALGPDGMLQGIRVLQ